MVERCREKVAELLVIYTKRPWIKTVGTQPTITRQCQACTVMDENFLNGVPLQIQELEREQTKNQSVA